MFTFFNCVNIIAFIVLCEIVAFLCVALFLQVQIAYLVSAIIWWLSWCVMLSVKGRMLFCMAFVMSKGVPCGND